MVSFHQPKLSRLLLSVIFVMDLGLPSEDSSDVRNNYLLQVAMTEAEAQLSRTGTK